MSTLYTNIDELVTNDATLRNANEVTVVLKNASGAAGSRLVADRIRAALVDVRQ